MAPRLVNEILAGMTCRHDLGSTFATRHHVMPAGRNLTFTEGARLGHKKLAGSISNQGNIENGGRSGNRTHDRLTCRLAVRQDLSLHNISKWYARPVTLRVQALI